MEYADWPGVIDPEALSAGFVAERHRLADAARAGEWPGVLEALDSSHWLTVNQWRIGGDSWFAPLHQAAWRGAPRSVVEELLRRGAWRSLRTADGDRPVDLAARRGHDHLADMLAVADLEPDEMRRHDAWDRHLAALIGERTAHLDPVRLRPVPTELLARESIPRLWLAYPGMYGGFGITRAGDRLRVTSTSRIAGGWGQEHEITEAGCELVAEGLD